MSRENTTTCSGCGQDFPDSEMAAWLEEGGELCGKCAEKRTNKMRVVIEFENVPDGMPPDEIKYAIHFAVSEYWQRRDPPEQYVEKRYAHMSEGFRYDKVQRIRRAVTLMNSARINVEIMDADAEWRNAK